MAVREQKVDIRGGSGTIAGTLVLRACSCPVCSSCMAGAEASSST